jgi:hypothetical protein
MMKWTKDNGTNVWRATAPDGGMWKILETRSGHVLSFNDEVVDSDRSGTYRWRAWSDAARRAESANECRI